MNARIRDLIAEYEEEGNFTRVAPTDEMLASAEHELGVTLPQQFVDYLREYSDGGVAGVEILGVDFTGSMLFLDTTLRYRTYGLPHNLVVIENYGEWMYCPDCDTGEVVSWSRMDGIPPASPSFDDFLLQELEDAIENM